MQLISTIWPHFDYSSFLSSNLTKFDSVFRTNFNWSPHISSLAFLVYTRRGVSLHWNGRHVFLTEYWRYINAFLQNLGWFVQMKYRFSERKQSQPRTYLFHTLDVHVKLYGVNFFFIRWNWEFQPWILLLLSQRQWLWSAFFLFMFFPARIPRKVPSIITLIDIRQRDKWLDWNQAAGWLHKWIEIKLANGEELDWNKNGKWTCDRI